MPPGLLSEYRSESGSDSEDEEDEDDWEEAGGRGRGRSGGDATDAEQEAVLRALPPGVRARLQEQAARLARLEEENLDLKEVRITSPPHAASPVAIRDGRISWRAVRPRASNSDPTVLRSVAVCHTTPECHLKCNVTALGSLAR